MRLVGYLWTTFFNLLLILLVLAMFGAASSRFETMVVSALTIIYATVVSSTTVVARDAAERGAAIGGLLVQILHRLGDPTAPQIEEGLKEGKRQYESLTVKYYMNAAGLTVMWLIALWNLIGAV